MLLQECCKEDDKGKWEMAKFDPQYSKLFTNRHKISTSDYVGDTYHHAKFH